VGGEVEGSATRAFAAEAIRGWERCFARVFEGVAVSLGTERIVGRDIGVYCVGGDRSGWHLRLEYKIERGIELDGIVIVIAPAGELF